MPLANALQPLPQPLYVNQTLSCVLLHMDMLVQVVIVDQSIELRSGLMLRRLAASLIVINSI